MNTPMWEEQYLAIHLYKYGFEDAHEGTYQLVAVMWRVAHRGWRAAIYETPNSVKSVVFPVPDAETGKQMVEDILALRRST